MTKAITRGLGGGKSKDTAWTSTTRSGGQDLAPGNINALSHFEARGAGGRPIAWYKGKRLEN